MNIKPELVEEQVLNQPAKGVYNVGSKQTKR